METALPILIDQFIATKQTEGKSAKTTSWYRQMLDRFYRFLGEQASIKDVTLNNARAFIAHLQEKTRRWENHPISHAQEGGLSTHTIHGYVRTLKVFGTWLAEEGLAGYNPFERLKRPRLPSPVIEVLSDEEIEAINNAINPNCIQGARMYTAALLLLDTGMRANELLRLTLHDIDWNEQLLNVFGKGNKGRLVPFGPTAKRVLQRYVATWRPESESKQLILSLEGTPLTYDALFHLVKRLGETAGVPRLHPHLFRHTFAVKYLMNGGDVMSLKRILGHVTLDVTQVYMHLAESHVQGQHAKFSPVEKLGLKPRKRS
jgi:site-specific recombinase XerD